MGCHVLDILDFLLGPLKEVNGDAARVADSDLPVETVVSMRFRVNQAMGSALFNFVASKPQDRLSIDGTHGRLELSVFGSEAPCVHLHSSAEMIELTSDDVPHVHQPLMQSIVDELRSSSSKCASTGYSALRTALVLDQVLNKFYRDRSDRFWERPETWLN